jgi:HKD family nuclease
VRYIDSGTRDPAHTVGQWLSGQAIVNVAALKFQVGYFASSGLDFLKPILTHLRSSGRPITAVVGSNSSDTIVSDVNELIALAGSPRAGVDLAVVSYGAALFHPKIYFIERTDGSRTAYLGSANLSKSGISGQNIEAGLLVDTNDGDPTAILDEIETAIDAWFGGGRGGVHLVMSPADSAKLLADGILSAAGFKASTMPPKTTSAGVAKPSLSPLVKAPAPPPSAPAPPAPAPTLGPAPAHVSARVLIAEIGGGERWKQANFPIATITGFFGVTPGSHQQIRLTHILPGGGTGSIETPRVVAVKSQNYRFELASVGSTPYPTSGNRPIAVFVEQAPRDFAYRVFFSGDPGYADLDAFLAANYTGPKHHLRRVTTIHAALLAAWPGSFM